MFYIFDDCYYLETVNLSSSLKNIKTNAFLNCSALKSITIPASVEYIHSYVFEGCDALERVNAQGTTPSFLHDKAFSNYSIPLTVPEGLAETYRAADGWSNFTTIKDGGTYYQLTVTSGSGGSVSYFTATVTNTSSEFEVKEGTTVTLTITADENYQLDRVMVNGQDQTAQVDGNGVLTLENVSADMTVSVEYSTTQQAAETGNALSINNMEVFTGKTATLSILMNNTEEITGLQMDLYLPEGITVAQNDKGKNLIEVSERMEEQYSVSSNAQDDGAIRITGLSLESEPFTGSEGAILYVTLNIDEEMADGDYTIALRKIGLSDVSGTYHQPANTSATVTVKSYTLGDVDNSGDININDAVCIVNHILNKPIPVFVEPAADLDGSGDININDPVVLINRYILHKTNARMKQSALKRAANGDGNYLQIATVNMKPGETKTIAVEMKNTEDIIGTQCKIRLPEGLSFAYTIDKKGKTVYTMALNEDRRDDHTLSPSIQEDGSMIIAIISLGGESFYENEGSLFTFDVVADAEITPGGYEIQMTDIVLSSGVAIKPADRISILNVIPDLDEDVAQFEITNDIPEADVTLKRTIVAGKYNTLVLPFDLTDAEVKTAFGSDATVYVFSNVTDGDVIFNSTTAGIEANKPVLLKTSTAGTSYEFTGVTLKPGVAIATGSNLDFVGNYGGDILLSENVYFLNDNKLYRSKDKSRLKGYRAFFQEKGTGAARLVNLNIDGDATTIDFIEADEDGETLYRLSGQKVGQQSSANGKKLRKGVYVSKGKKIVVR